MSLTYIYIDESGDLGLHRGTSYFTIAAIITRNRNRIERIPLRIRKKRLKKSIKRKSELKFHNSEDRIKRMLLSMLMEKKDFSIAAITIDKKRMKPELERYEEKLFNIIIIRLICDLIGNNNLGQNILLTIDPRRSGKISDQKFDIHIYSEIERYCTRFGENVPFISISRLDSQVSKGLQVADFVAGAIRRKYELNDNIYYDIIVDSIAIEKTIII